MAYDLVAKLRLDDRMSRPLRNAMRQMDNVGRATSRASGALDSYRDSTGRMRTANSRFVTEARRGYGQVEDGIQNANKKTGGLAGSLGKLGTGAAMAGATAGFAAIAGSVAAAAGGVKIMTDALKEAASFEQSAVLIEAMFDDKQASDAYMKMVDKLAQESPILNSGDMFAGSKSFISLSKDADVLADAWGIVEKLNVLDPVQGVEGAVLALRELAGGDAISLVERFEMPRKALNDIKGLSFERQLEEMGKLLGSMNMTDEVVEKMGDTTISKWNQIKEKSQASLRAMGETGNSEIGKALDRFNQFLESGSFNKLTALGDQAIGGFITSTINGIDWAINAFDRLKKSPAVVWMQTTLPPIFDKIRQAVETSMGSGGIGQYIVGAKSYLNDFKVAGLALWGLMKEMWPGVQKVLQDVWIIAQPILRALGTAVRVIGDIVGTVITSLVIPSLRNTWAGFTTLWSIVSPILKYLAAGIEVTFSYLEFAWREYVKPILQFMGDRFTQVFEIIDPVLSGIRDGFDFVGRAADDLLNQVSGVTDALAAMEAPAWLKSGAKWVSNGLNSLTPSGVDGSHYHGLDYVKRDGYQASLHRGEMVLNRREADAYRSGSGGGVTVSVTGNTFNVREEADIDRIADRLAGRILQAGAAGA